MTDPASLPSDLPLRCRCGHVRGVASEVSSGFRFLCYCKDCQAFARFLGRADALDAAGGTDIFQMPPARVTLTAGAEALRCLRFSSKVLRWYADCCRTPIGNTAADARFPVVAVIHCFMDHQADGRSRDAALGPALCRRATPTDGAAAALVRDLRASRNEAAGLVGARARPADSVLRQSHKRALLRAARAHAS